MFCFVFFFKQKTAYEMLRSLVGSEMCIRDRPWVNHPPCHTMARAGTGNSIRCDLTWWFDVYPLASESFGGSEHAVETTNSTPSQPYRRSKYLNMSDPYVVELEKYCAHR